MSMMPRQRIALLASQPPCSEVDSIPLLVTHIALAGTFAAELIGEFLRHHKSHVEILNILAIFERGFIRIVTSRLKNNEFKGHDKSHMQSVDQG